MFKKKLYFTITEDYDGYYDWTVRRKGWFSSYIIRFGSAHTYNGAMSAARDTIKRIKDREDFYKNNLDEVHYE